MPIFEFRCNDCHHQFEQMIFPTLASSSADEALKCPECSGERIQKLMSPGSFRPRGIPKGKGGFNPPKCARNGS